MSAVRQNPMTLAQFLAWEERQDLRYEFDGFQPVAMTGGIVAHDQITFNLRKALDARLVGMPCRPLGPNTKIIVDGGARYPDAIVVCLPVSPDASVVDDPVIVFEVLKYPPAKPGALGFWPLKAAGGVADAAQEL